MSDSNSSGPNASSETFRTARNAVGSAAEQMKASASGAYDAGAKASQYVGSTASEHPLTTLLITAGLAFLAGVLTSRSQGGNQTWRESAEAVRRQVQSAAPSTSDMASYVRDQVGQSAGGPSDYVAQGAKGAADYVTRGARGTGGFVTQGVQEYPVSVLLTAAVLGGVLGYLSRTPNG